MYPLLQLKPKRERSVLFRHPWIFSGALANKPDAQEGAIVEVRNSEHCVLGYGFYSANSQISCRMFHWADAAEDFISTSYWQKKILNALSLRKKIIHTHTNAYRLLHAEGDFMPGIIADVYDNVLVLQLLIKGVEHIKHVITEALIRCGFKNIYLKIKSGSQNIEKIDSDAGWVAGIPQSVVLIKEHGLIFEVDVEKGQKTGFFLDQRENRLLLKNFCLNKKVLNTFCYTGGFSVYAAAGGAAQIDSVDISEEAVCMTTKNMQINNFSSAHNAYTKDCFDYLKDMEQNYYDIIILDPPAFAKNARSVENAARGYKQINMRAMQKINPGGFIFTFSCSQNISKELFQKIVFGAAADAQRNVRILQQLSQPADHPVNIYHPEGEYLKGLLLYVE
jgi:23S rRNA (cytosine1962-C5)-methyltransferase